MLGIGYVERVRTRCTCIRLVNKLDGADWMDCIILRCRQSYKAGGECMRAYSQRELGLMTVLLQEPNFAFVGT